jgi:hypothetical protein
LKTAFNLCWRRDRKLPKLWLPRLPVISMLFGGRGYVTGEIFLRMILAGLGLTVKTSEEAPPTQ